MDGVNFKLGTWGFCAGDVCSNSTLGYSLGASGAGGNEDQRTELTIPGLRADVDALFGTSGSAASSSIPETLIKWMVRCALNGTEEGTLTWEISRRHTFSSSTPSLQGLG